MSEGVFELTILGRLLEHLGVQMYKRRDVALAELVANAWDAGAGRVEITFDTDPAYEPKSSSIVVCDDGCGMARSEIEPRYLGASPQNRPRPGTALSFSGS